MTSNRARGEIRSHYPDIRLNTEDITYGDTFDSRNFVKNIGNNTRETRELEEKDSDDYRETLEPRRDRTIGKVDKEEEEIQLKFTGTPLVDVFDVLYRCMVSAFYPTLLIVPIRPATLASGYHSASVSASGYLSRTAMVDSQKANVLWFVNASVGGSASMGCEEAATPRTNPQASSADVDKVYSIDELELEGDNGKEKSGDGVDYSGSGLPLIFSMKQNTILDVNAMADFRLPRMFMIWILGKSSISHRWDVCVVGNGNSTYCPFL